jgi:hypothetical protein
MAEDSIRYQGINIKEARTPTAKRAVEMRNLAWRRNLLKVVADRLLAKMSTMRLQPELSTQLALAGLIEAAGKTGDLKYRKFAEDSIDGYFKVADAFAKPLWSCLRASLPLSPEGNQGAAADAISFARSGRAVDATPTLCALAAGAQQFQGEAADILLKYISNKRKLRPGLYGEEHYTFDEAYHVIRAAAAYPEQEKLAKESILAAAAMLGKIPEPGALLPDPADTGLILCAFELAEKRLSWWQAAPSSMDFWHKIKRPAAVDSLTDVEVSLLAKELRYLDCILPLPGFFWNPSPEFATDPQKRLLDVPRITFRPPDLVELQMSRLQKLA